MSDLHRRTPALGRALVSAAAVLAFAAGAAAQSQTAPKPKPAAPEPAAVQPPPEEPDAATDADGAEADQGQGDADEPEKVYVEPEILAVGDKAPPLQIESWIQGEPVTGFESGKVYVVHFWAPWSSICMDMVPQLNALHDEYKDRGLRVIAVTGADKLGNSVEKVEELLAGSPDQMGYTIAWDTERQTRDAYMRAAKYRGLPTTFVVDRDGRIAVIHQRDASGIMEPVREMIEGVWDTDAAAEEYRKGTLVEVRARELDIFLGELVRQKEFEKVVALLDEQMHAGLKPVSALALQKFEVLLARLKDAERASAWGREILDQVAPRSPEALNGLAWTIVDTPDLETRDLALALEAAERANKLTQERNPAVLDTVARVYFMMGNVEKAVEVQERAAEFAPGTPYGREIAHRLHEYRLALKQRQTQEQGPN